MASMAWMDIGGGYHGYHTYFNYGHSTAQIRYGPRGIDASSEHEPGPAQRRTSPSVVSHASPSLTQAVTASCSRCWPKQTRERRSPRPFCSSLGEGRRRGLPRAAAGCLGLSAVALRCCSCCAFVCTFPSPQSFLPPSPHLSASLSLLSHLHSH